jgi:hypothetical protein
MRAGFTNAVRNAWSAPGRHATGVGRQRQDCRRARKLAIRRIDDYFQRMVQEQATFVPIPTPLSMFCAPSTSTLSTMPGLIGRYRKRRRFAIQLIQRARRVSRRRRFPSAFSSRGHSRRHRLRSRLRQRLQALRSE